MLEEIISTIGIYFVVWGLVVSAFGGVFCVIGWILRLISEL